MRWTGILKHHISIFNSALSAILVLYSEAKVTVEKSPVEKIRNLKGQCYDMTGLGETDSWKKPEIENLVALSLLFRPKAFEDFLLQYTMIILKHCALGPTSILITHLQVWSRSKFPRTIFFFFQIWHTSRKTMFEAKDLETMDKDQLMKIIREQNSQLINLQVWSSTC